MNSINFQSELRPALPIVYASKDYTDYRANLVAMDQILESGLENQFIIKKITSNDQELSYARIMQLYRITRIALRHSILLGLTGESHRKLAIHIADSQLLQWFTYTQSIDVIRTQSKSAIERYEKMFTNEEITDLIHTLNQSFQDTDFAAKNLYISHALRFDKIFADTTCIKANIHFPVDWILLRDATRTLIKAIILIRSHGLLHRIGSPKSFVNTMNKLCIEMTHARKTKDAKKKRKLVLRRMKKITKTIKEHAENYHELLKIRWEETDWSEIETQVVLDRIMLILDQLPNAIDQAHERIIGERRVATKDKILSLYEPDIHVLVRGKSGAEVEFGNGLYLAEQADGLIVDWDFLRKQPPGDNKLVSESLTRITKNYGSIDSYATDRGFDSPGNDELLEEQNIFNAICPRSVSDLKEKLRDPQFCDLQKRRGSTEARIGIFKNNYLGKPLRSKGFKNRSIRIEWCILTHNLWKLASMAVMNRDAIEKQEKIA